MIKEEIVKASRNQDLSYEEAANVMDEIMSGTATEIQMAAYLTAMSTKGETTDEITASAAIMRKHCIKLLNDEDVLEIVGTGGDKSNSFNISTTAAIVVSSYGIPVAKHGNRAASSKSGAADILESLGVNITLSPEKSHELLKKINLCFLFAQNYHLAMKYVAPVRTQLGIRTIFNILGPLTNPAGAKMQLLGVYEEELVQPMTEVLSNLGVKNAMVVYGKDKLDEISVSDDTLVCELRNGFFKKYIFNPEEYGIKKISKKELIGGTPEENAKITIGVLKGERGPRRDAVIINSAAAIYIAKPELKFEETIKIAEDLIDSGRAIKQLERFIKLSNE